MKRTQIYLEETQRRALDKLAARKGKALAELIREAVDRYITDNNLEDAEYIIETSGIWKNRDDIDSQEYLTALRSELNTRLEKHTK